MILHLKSGCMWLSYVRGAVFGPDMVTGVQHEHFKSAAAIGWIFSAIATGLVVTAALQGIRARVTDKAPWIMLGLGTGVIWLANMFVAIFAPVSVTGTDPRRGHPYLDSLQIREDGLLRADGSARYDRADGRP